MEILISGAGIGGLTAGLCLLKAGHKIRILEKSHTFSDVGAGIQCGANALRVFDYLGLLEQLEAVSVEPECAVFRDHQSGEILHQLIFGKEYRSRYGAPYLHIHRADLHEILLKEFLALSPNSIQMNSELVDFLETNDQVTITLANKSTLSTDCLIACDGIKSKIRQLRLGNVLPKYTGNIAWRGIVKAQDLPNDFMEKVVTNFVGPKKHMVVYYLRKQRLVNFVGVIEKPELDNDAHNSWVKKAAWEELEADFKDWHPSVQTIINTVNKDECYQWALYDHISFKNWSSSRVTLLGDAAHATLPFMASGAAMAIEDARILQRALDSCGTVAESLNVYQRNRYQRTAKIQSMSRQAGKLYHISNKFLLKTAFKALALRPKATETFLPEYDANSVELF